MTRVAPFFLVFLLPILLVLGVERGGVWAVAPLLFSFALVPVLDAVLEPNRENGDESLGHRLRFDVPLALWVPVQLGVTVYVVWRLSHGLHGGEFSPAHVIGCVVSLGVLNGAGGINIAHELMHRKRAWARAGAELLMTSVSYTHFCIEHVLGHHRTVATPDDPASSRLGESLYRFLPRTLIGSLRSAWRLEAERCAAKQIPWTSLRDRRTRYLLVLAAVYVGIGIGVGPLALVLFIAQGVVAFSLLEVINYIEHYGLLRRKLASGKYERVRPEHSWNSAHLVSNLYLFNLARHSDHHYLASREYDRLRHHADAPQMPTGYAGMVLLALVPPLWFRVMNPRVAAWREQHAIEAEPVVVGPRVPRAA